MSHPSAPSHLFIIFGATGDLTMHKLAPALSRLASQALLPEKWALLGVARSADVDENRFRELVREALAATSVDPGIANRWCDEFLHYECIGEYTDESFGRLRKRIEDIEKERGLSGNRVFYLALPPGAFPATLNALGDNGLNRSGGWTRVVIEKPFGRDLESAHELNELAHRHFDESQIYRIDHYLGKETVQNLLVFRSANAMFESLWNRDRVESVQIIVGEDHGIGSRAGYYDKSGAVRDMIQNHMSQLVSLIAMELPPSFEPDAVRYEKIKVLRSVEEIRSENVVFGQYETGEVGGRRVPGYKEERGVAPHSTTETFAALRLHIDTWRWQGVPFLLRTGKRMNRRITQISVFFKHSPVCVFKGIDECALKSNVLTMTLQPNEGFALSFDVKGPGEPFSLSTQRLDFDYKDAFGPLQDAYTTLLLDVMTGDPTLFVHADEVESSWRLYAPLLESKHEIFRYAAGSWGPAEADKLIREDEDPWTVL